MAYSWFKQTHVIWDITSSFMSVRFLPMEKSCFWWNPRSGSQNFWFSWWKPWASCWVSCISMPERLLQSPIVFCWKIDIPSGKPLHNYGKSSFLMGKSTISMAMFNSFLYVYQRVPSIFCPLDHLDPSGEIFCAVLMENCCATSIQARLWPKGWSYGIPVDRKKKMLRWSHIQFVGCTSYIYISLLNPITSPHQVVL